MREPRTTTSVVVDQDKANWLNIIMPNKQRRFIQQDSANTLIHDRDYSGRKTMRASRTTITVACLAGVITAGLGVYFYPFAERAFIMHLQDREIEKRVAANSDPASIQARKKNAIVFDFQNYTWKIDGSGLFNSFGNIFSYMGTQLGPKDKELVENACREVLSSKYPQNEELGIGFYSPTAAQDFATRGRIIATSSKEYDYRHDYGEGTDRSLGTFRMTGKCKGTEYIVEYQSDSPCAITSTNKSTAIAHKIYNQTKEPDIRKDERILASAEYLDYESQPDEIVFLGNLFITDDQRLQYKAYPARNFNLNKCRFVSEDTWKLGPDSTNRLLKNRYQIYALS